jgi:hypothetical protein
MRNHHLALRVLVLLVSCASLGTTRAAQPDRLEFPSFGVSVPVPSGFRRDADGQSTVVVLSSRAEAGQPPTRTLTLDFFPKRDQRLVQHALAMARVDKVAQMRKGPRVKWGDRDAYEVVGQPAADGEGLFPLRELLAERDGWVFRLVYAARREHADDVKAYEEFADGIRWTDVDAAGKGVADPGRTTPLGNGMSVRMPDPFRLHKESKTSMVWEAVDLTAQRSVARVVVLRAGKDDEPHTLDDFKAGVEKHMTKDAGLTEPFRWDPANSGPTFATTPLIRSRFGWNQYLAVVPDGERAAAFWLICDSLVEPKATAGFEPTLDLIRKSIDAAGGRERQ